MKCPACAYQITDPEPACPVCGFSFDELAAKVPELPTEDPGEDVYDPEAILGRVGAARVRDRLERFEERAGGSLRVVILPSVAPLSGPEATFWLFNQWQLGGERGRAVLLLWSPEDRLVQCEVGYGFEDCIRDEEIGRVLDYHVVPLLKKGVFEEALFQAVHLLAELIEASPALDGAREDA